MTVPQPSLDDEDLDRMEKCARDAAENLPGDWRLNDEAGEVDFLDKHAGEERWTTFARCSGGCLEWVSGSDHIATFDPPACIALITEIRALRAAMKEREDGAV